MLVDPTVSGQDPQQAEMIRRAQLLAAIMGKPAAPGVPGAAGASQPAIPGFLPTDMTPAAAAAPQPGASAVAKPLSTPQGAAPGSASKAPGGMTRSASISDPEATNAANQPPLPTFQSEEEWNKANPAAVHTPYQAPDLKHRLLEGLFAGMQEFGRPGEGAATIRDYLGDIRKNQEAEESYPETSAAAQHQRYMTAA